MILNSVQRLANYDSTEIQRQELGVKASIKTSSFNDLDVAIKPLSLTLRDDLSLHSALLTKDPAVLEAKTLAKQDLSKAIDLLLYSLKILVQEYL